jgi:hypothetical protein
LNWEFEKMSPPDINYMPASIVPGGQAVATGGNGPVVIAKTPGDGAYNRMIRPIVSLKEIVAVQVGATGGAAGNLILTGVDSTPSGMSPTMAIPVGPSIIGTRIVQDFAVPYRGEFIRLEVEAGAGNWKIITVGFYS